MPINLMLGTALGTVASSGAGGFPAMPKFAAAQAARAAGTRNARVLILSDSTGWGQGAGGILNGGNGRAFSWPTQLAGLVTAGAWQSFFGNGSTTSTNYYPAMDTRDVPGSWTLGGASAKSIGAFPYTASTAVTRSFSPTTAFDTIELSYAKFSGAGTFTVNVDGGATLATVNSSNASNALGSITITCPLGAHTINITWASGGAVTVDGGVVYNSAIKETTIINGGVSGGAIADFIVATSPWSPLNMIPALAPDLVIVDLTINDTTLGTSLATYQAGLQSIIDKAKTANADVLFVTGNPIDPVATGASQVTQQSYVDAFKATAGTNGIGVIDIFALFGDYTTANGKGWMFDSKHPTSIGYTQIANAVAARLGIDTSTYVFANSEAATFVGAMSPAPNNNRKAVIDTFYGSVKTGAISGSNIFSKLDCFYLFAAHASQAALLNGVSRGYGDSTTENSPTFTIDKGFTSASSGNKAVNTGVAGTRVGNQFTRNAASMGVWTLGQPASNSTTLGNGTMAINSLRTDTAVAGAVLNDFSLLSIAATDAISLISVNRSSSAARQIYKNGVLGNSDTQASGVNPDAMVLRFGGNGSFSVDALGSVVYQGGSLTANENKDWYNACRAYLIAVGAIPAGSYPVAT